MTVQQLLDSNIIDDHTYVIIRWKGKFIASGHRYQEKIRRFYDLTVMEFFWRVHSGRDCISITTF